MSAASAVLRKVSSLILVVWFVSSQGSLAQAQDRILIGGTGSALAAMKLLADEYTKSHEDTDFVIVPSLGSSDGIKALIAGKVDIALSARALKNKEKNKGVAAVIYARAPMVFATHFSNAETNISYSQLQSAYTGELLEWPDGLKLRLIMRPPSESDIKIIKSLSAEIGKAVDTALNNPGSFVALNDQDNASALERIQGSLGFLSLGQLLAERRLIKPLALENIVGTVAGVAQGTYPHVKTHRLVLAQNCSPVVQSFVRFVFSENGKNILVNNGHVAPAASGNIDQCFGAK